MALLTATFKMVGTALFMVLISSSVANQGSKSLRIPSLGRPFELGDLYDVRADQIVKGPKLWSSDHLKDYHQIIQRQTDFEIIASDNVDSQKNHFDINASLRLSFLSGLVEVKGSAGFLDDRVKTSNTARVSLKYDTRTFAREIRPELFTKVDTPEVLKKAPGATHVVIGIEYGVGAVFVFEQSLKVYEDKKDVTGSMEVAVKNLPGIEIEGSGAVNITEEEKKITKDFTCKFHGDLVLDEQPGNYVEAVRVYKRLPILLGKDYENSVPMSIWLYPLDALPISKESELVHEIRNSLVNEVMVQMDQLEALEVRCNDILESKMATYHERINNNVATFKSHIHLFVLLFKQVLAKLLPAIRASGREGDLARLLAEKEDSTFSQNNLNLWLKDTEQEAVVLTSTQTLPHYCKDEGDFAAKLLNGPKYTIALVMRLDIEEDDFLQEMKEWLDKAKTITRNPLHSPYFGRRHKWWQYTELLSDLQRKSRGFAEFSRLNDKQKEVHQSNVQFLTIEKIIQKENGNSKPSVTLELFDDAALINPDIEIPSEPGIPRNISSSYQSMMLSWKKPVHGEVNVEFYEVETFLLNTNGSKFEKVKTVKVSKGSRSDSEMATISNLKPERLYSFSVYAVSVLGRVSVSKHSPLLATDTCPPGMFFSNEECKPCPPMEYSNRKGARSCLKCVPGSVSLDYGSKECYICPRGTYANQRCIPCNPGTFSDITGANECQKCPQGTYEPGFGGSSCKNCPKGSTTIVSGSKYIDDCGADLNGKIKSTLDEFKKGIKKWQKEVDEKLKHLMAHRYRFISTEMSWYDARDHCKKLGGTLALNDNKADITEIMKASGDKIVWVGLAYSGTGGITQKSAWHDMCGTTPQFDGWDRSAPADYHESGHFGICAWLSNFYERWINNSNCDYTLPFVCDFYKHC